jgi:hypothetical protein
LKQSILAVSLALFGGGLFACPGGMVEGEFIGQRLFDTA